MLNNICLDCSKMNFGEIKEFIDKIKIESAGSKKWRVELENIAKILAEDSRKNVNSLSEKLFKYIEATDREIFRVRSMYDFDKGFSDTLLIAGVDEVGRGPLAGPIVAASVILDLKVLHDEELLLGIKDSKKLSSNRRQELAEIIKDKAICYSIEEINNVLIDSRGISWCNNEVFRKSVWGLKVRPELVLSDGYPIRNFNIRNEFVIKGDEKSASIACASIIAKVYRDNLMSTYSELYPYYGFEDNSGYGTREHIEALRKHGPSKIHRISFLKNLL